MQRERTRPGCNATRSGKRAQAHSDPCRVRIEERLKMTPEGAERPDRRSDKRGTKRRRAQKKDTQTRQQQHKAVPTKCAPASLCHLAKRLRAVDVMMDVDRVSGAAQRRRGRRLRAASRREQQSIAQALATFTHHSDPRRQTMARAGRWVRDEVHCQVPERTHTQTAGYWLLCSGPSVESLVCSVVKFRSARNCEHICLG